MKEKITLFIASSDGSSLIQKTVSKTVLFGLCLISTLCVLSFCFIMFDYFALRLKFGSSQTLADRISSQKQEIINQRKQIHSFADQINSLKSDLINLNGFENKIRIIANIDQSEEGDNIFGIGGSMPEDIATDVSLSETHNSLLREMHDQLGQLKYAAINQKNGFESLLKFLDDQRNLLASTPAIHPTKGWITSRFGYRKSPFTGRREFHKGFDIANRIGTPVIATADGVVTYTGGKGLYGKTIVIDHGHGMMTTYAHLSKFSVNRDDAVKRGDVIAQIGNTGRSTGPHLHYEIRMNGVSIDPEKYIID